jgi:hypothetical protein
MPSNPDSGPFYVPATPGWWLRPIPPVDRVVTVHDTPIIAWRIDGWKVTPVIPDEKGLVEQGMEIVSHE